MTVKTYVEEKLKDFPLKRNATEEEFMEWIELHTNDAPIFNAEMMRLTRSENTNDCLVTNTTFFDALNNTCPEADDIKEIAKHMVEKEAIASSQHN